MGNLKLNAFLILAIINVLLFQCQRIATQSFEKIYLQKDMIMEIVSSDTLCLSWDKPADTQVVSRYAISYCPHNSSKWTTLNKFIPANDSPIICINRSEISSSDNLFDFAVRAYFENGDSSEMSASTDSIYSSHKGWFVKW